MRLLESQNLYPDCISLELEPVATERESFALIVNLNFNQQWKSLLNGRIKFGLKGCKLSIRVENGVIALETPNFGEDFTVITQVREKDYNWTLALKTSRWVFSGILEKVKLGTLKVSKHPCYVSARITVAPWDISLTDAEGLWKHDISPNKHGVLERKLALCFWETKFTPYLSQIQLGTEGSQPEKQASKREENLLTAEKLAQLQTVIDQVYNAKTNNFRELAQLAGLNPLKDFAGANLIAADLSEVELGGANLCHVNFRGANLTDADLSETDLNHAKLSGADLSGALLGNANLSYCDLHKASLALANLIGADLTGANLQEVNLSQANLSGAKIQGAYFHDNPGVTAMMRESLQQRGAVLD